MGGINSNFSSKSIEKLSKEIRIGNRDFGAFELVNAYLREFGQSIADSAIEKNICDLLDKAGGENLEAIKKKVSKWITSGRGIFERDKKLSSLQLAEKTDEYFEDLIYLNQQFRSYQKGYWKEQNEKQVRKIISEIDKPYTRAGRTNDALVVLKDSKFEEINSQKTHLICCENGTYDLSKNVLLPHSREHFLLNRQNVEWDANSKCPLWLKTLDEIFQNDADAKEKIEALQIWFGYCLTPDTRQNKSMWLVGEGANGKSLICKILTELLGNNNVSNFMITGLDNSFSRSGLYGKLLNISTEIKADATLADSYFKAIVSGDTIQAERKFQDAFSFKATSRLLIATNHLPRILDSSHGFQRRLIILEFNRIFHENEQDKSREENLIKELPGILAWSVEGLQMLKNKDAFIIPKSSRQALDNYMKDSNPVQTYAEEYLEKDEWGKITASEIYAKYKEWAQENGFQSMNICTFGKKLKSLGYEKRKTNGRNVWKIKLFGISLTDRKEDEEEARGNINPLREELKRLEKRGISKLKM